MFEFNPKNNSLLDDQLAESGLEMNIFGIIAGVAGIASGIIGSQQASEQNAQAQSNYEQQKQAAEKQARLTNEYNKKVFAADKANYYAQREYEWDTAVKQWQYNSEIQDYSYLQTARQYLSSVENTQQQLTYNSVAAREAQEQEQASLAEILNSAAFQQEGMLIESMQREGRAALLQAGGSRAKALQSTIAEQGRNAAILSASLLSAGQQSQRNMRDIEMGRYADDLKARNAMMIKPERLPNIPIPITPPERVFVEPMEATAAYIPAPIQQSTFAPIVSGIAAGASGFAKADWKTPFDLTDNG
jgi:hypothetical protein